MIYRIGICDDDQCYRQYLSGLVYSWIDGRDYPVEIHEFSSAESCLFEWEDCGLDILLLDIEMETMTGVELAKILRQKDELLQIVFVTGYSDYIEEGYDVSALHYLLKPIHEEKLFHVLDRAMKRISKEESILMLEEPHQTVRIPKMKINYAEVQGNRVTIHADKDYDFRMTLSDLEQKLQDTFLRVGRTYIVNLNRINRVSRKEIYMMDGTVIPIPRGSYEMVNRAIIQMEK